MALNLFKIQVGPWPMNTYIIVCETSGLMAIVDPGSEPEKILESIIEIRKTLVFHTGNNSDLRMILITHGHPDHIGALDKIREETGAPVYIHPQDAALFDVRFDEPLINNENLHLGDMILKTVHTPGHTPGSTCIDLCDHRVIVGDTIFVGGPGKTLSASEFETTMYTLKTIVFEWPDDKIFFPGHGPHGRIGDERRKFEAFLNRGWSEDLYGDVIWE
jgi:hydroxyacylglutathione hydrolase